MESYDVVVLGSGPAGCSAAVYTSRALLKTLVIEGVNPGGQLMVTNDVENYPGFLEITGPTLMYKMRKHAEKCGAIFRSVNVDDILRNEDGSFDIICAKVTTKAKSVIIATGAVARKLQVPNEDRFYGSGISGCAVCDGFFFKGKDVVVVGGGNSAIEACLYLSNIVKSIILIHRRDEFRAEKVLIQRMQQVESIQYRLGYVVNHFIGSNAFEGLEIEHVTTKEKEVLKTDGVFIHIGHDPAVNMVSNLGLELLNTNHIKTIDNVRTNVPGVFAAGDVADFKYMQAVTAAGYGCMAALDVEQYISQLRNTA